MGSALYGQNVEVVFYLNAKVEKLTLLNLPTRAEAVH